MYLKSIEILGFKSFPYKTRLQFNTGVTGIVGPNGSGKSNISDAVRWVLGEQKAKTLRGGAMQDVIFSGTELKKAQGFAFVSLTLDNSDHYLKVDFSEVTVSRKLFRSGESEYMINGQQVRLKDVQELFFDTGIGRDGYSIIGQGMVDAVINGRPRDRRGIFDEAAGIIKLKKRKADSVKQLESVRGDTERIGDIISELDRQLEPLKRQSETAREYLRLKEEQKNLDLNIFSRITEGLLKSLNREKDSLSILESSLKDAEDESERLKNADLEVTKAIQSMDSELAAKNEETGRANILKENLSGQITVSETEIKSETQRSGRLSAESVKLSEALSRDYGQCVKYVTELSLLKKNLEMLTVDISGLIENGAFDPGSARIDELKDDIDRGITVLKNALPEEALRKAEDSAREISESSAGVTGPEGKTPGVLTADEDEEEFRLPDWASAIRGKKDDLEEITRREQANSKWLTRANDEYNELTEKQKTLESALNQLETRLAVTKSELGSAVNMAERYEGYGESVRAVMNEKKRIGGIRGVVADLFTTQKEYEVALETGLGSRVQNIVTDNEESAKACIDFLKRSRSGRATFLPLDAVRGSGDEKLSRALNERGAIGIASDLAKCESDLDGLKQYLLGNLLVVDDIDHALNIERKYRHSLRIVTLTGELLSAGGSISGGAYKKKFNLLGRNREILRLRGELSDLEKKVSLRREAAAELEKQIEEKSREADDLRGEAIEIKNLKNELSFGISADLRLRYAEIRQKKDFAGENIKRTLGSIEDTLGELKKNEAERKECEERLKQEKENIRERKADIEHLEKGIRETAEAVEKLKAERGRLADELGDAARRREELRNTMLDLQKDRIRLENQIEKDQQKIDDSSAYIWEEYGITLGEAKKFYDPGLGSESAVKNRLNGVKSRIKELGQVNVSAIDEYKEVSARYGLLSSQYEDLKISEGKLADIVAELDTRMKETFNERFSAIEKEFDCCFKELFGGGHTSLGLVYEDDEDGNADELEAGISIMVQPPGKKLQSIIQLSGGEKALTAIALLFAIQNLKPSPFCLLDEIEAALDDSNVYRFAEYLRKISDRTQFIVITHRRGTMESADRLYGVTMQEKGVSKLVSVDLIDDQLS